MLISFCKLLPYLEFLARRHNLHLFEKLHEISFLQKQSYHTLLLDRTCHFLLKLFEK